MCRRFRIEDNEAKHLEVYPGISVSKEEDVTPGKLAYGLVSKNNSIQLTHLVFGFASFDSSYVYNARCETAAQKPMFAPFFRNKVIFPCTSFYEKESDGTIYEYVSDDGFFLYLAGFYNNEGSFVLLTEKADRFRLSRVPVLIPEDQVSSYLMGLYDTKNLTKRKRPVFHRKGDWVQMSLF